MLRRVALVITDVSEELSASIIRVTRIDELETALAVNRNRWRASVVPSLSILVTLMTEALSFSETSVLTRITRRNIPEDTILHSHRRENRKSYTTFITSIYKTSSFLVGFCSNSSNNLNYRDVPQKSVSTLHTASYRLKCNTYVTLPVTVTCGPYFDIYRNITSVWGIKRKKYIYLMNFKNDSILIEDVWSLFSRRCFQLRNTCPLHACETGRHSEGCWTAEPHRPVPWGLMPPVKVWMIAVFGLANGIHLSRGFLPLLAT
jgi:hypothetical protein